MDVKKSLFAAVCVIIGTALILDNISVILPNVEDGDVSIKICKTPKDPEPEVNTKRSHKLFGKKNKG